LEKLVNPGFFPQPRAGLLRRSRHPIQLTNGPLEKKKPTPS
jgi:hypothetical protein